MPNTRTPRSKHVHAILSALLLGLLAVIPAQSEPTRGIKPGDDRQPIQGKVIEKIDASNYTYLRLKTSKEEVWVAVPQIDIKLNSSATLKKPIPMFGFESKTLKRKFDRIYFGVLTEQAQELQKGTQAHWIPGLSQKPAASHPAHPTISKDSTPIALNEIRLKKADGQNAVTVSELFSRKSDYRAKTVVIRGKVIKYNPDILGKNWLHIADGTGTLKGKNFDLTVITKDRAKPGDIVVVTGKVILDKKLDPYFFPIAIEDAQLKLN